MHREVLIALLESDDADLVDDAISGVWRLAHDPAIERALIPLLDHDVGSIRAEAIKVLGARWGLPAFRERAQQMMSSDPHPDARAMAVRAWGSYHAGTQDPEVLRDLHRVATDKGCSAQERSMALFGLLRVNGVPKTEWPKPRGTIDIDQETDWSLFERLVPSVFGGNG